MSKSTSISWTDHHLARFWDKVDRREPAECWPWLAATTKGGYGVFTLPCGRHTTANRAAFIISNGYEPEGLKIDHKCRNRACVNPAHLEAVTNQENTLRGLRGRMVTHCPQGHQRAKETMEARKDGRRGACLICRRERDHYRGPRGSVYWNAVNQKRKTKSNG